MNVSVKDINGKEVRKLELDAAIFAVKPNQAWCMRW